MVKLFLRDCMNFFVNCQMMNDEKLKTKLGLKIPLHFQNQWYQGWLHSISVEKFCDFEMSQQVLVFRTNHIICFDLFTMKKGQN